jgi:predicted GNAT family acetyltransferase
MSNLEVNIEKISINSPYLEEVKKLGRANAKTLGHFPNGAFDDYAKRKQILIAIDKQNKFLGYLLYANPYHKYIRIHHLSTVNEARGRGIAKLLVEHLKQTTREFLDIRLVCRQDYGIDSMWENFGFTPMYEKQGKSKQGHLVTTWVYNHGHHDLFSIRFDRSQAQKLYVVIDACIFLDLYSTSTQTLLESELACLLADWVRNELELCITDEVNSEINHHPNKNTRDKIREFADSSFLKLTCSSQIFESIQKEIVDLFEDNNAKDISAITIRQLARIIASEQSSFLVTTNTNLLSFARTINNKYGFFIVSPNELIVRLDELRKASEYQPAPLAGTKLLQKKVSLEDQATITELFCFDDKDDFSNKLKKMLAKAEIYECFAVWEENIPIALIVYDRSKSHELSIPIFRVRYRSLSETLARHIVYRAITLSANEGRTFTKLTEIQIEDSIVRVVQDAGFTNIQDNWLKVNLKIVSPAVELSKMLLNISSSLGEQYNICRLIADNLRSLETSDIEYISELEKLLYPTKISDYDIPNFIIPIKPTWAKELFDEGLAKQSFLGSERSELALNWEAVYYRKKKLPSQKFKSPARILWYVSEDNKDRGYRQTMAIRACSTLDEVIIGNAEELYLRFQRLGIFKWSDIKDLSGDTSSNEIMAVKFSNTELFENPIPLQKIREILKPNVQFLSPQFITNEDFFKIYSIGCSR